MKLGGFLHHRCVWLLSVCLLVHAHLCVLMCVKAREKERNRQSWDSCSNSTVIIIQMFVVLKGRQRFPALYFVMKILFKIKQYFTIFAADKVVHNKSWLVVIFSNSNLNDYHKLTMSLCCFLAKSLCLPVLAAVNKYWCESPSVAASI